MQRFPLTQEQSEQRGYGRKIEQYNNGSSSQSPDIVICPVSKKPFRIMAFEVDMYNKLQIPLPIYHYNVRHQQRMARRLPRTIPTQLFTTY